jgi:hypothetical protein
VQLVRVAAGAEDQLGSTLRFCSPRSAYVSGQVISISPSDRPAGGLAGRAAGARHRRGARDRRGDRGRARARGRVGRAARCRRRDIELDITTAEAPEVIARHFGTASTSSSTTRA